MRSDTVSAPITASILRFISERNGAINRNSISRKSALVPIIIVQKIQSLRLRQSEYQ